MCTPTFGGGGKRQRVVKTLDLYEHMPEEGQEISLHAFEEFALDRKRVLDGVHKAHAMGMKHDEMKATIDTLLRRCLPEHDRLKDRLSHSILCVAYSRTADLQRWFVQQEDRLFKHHFNALGLEGRTGTMCLLRGAEWTAITKDEYTAIEKKLMAVFGGRNMNINENSYSNANAEHFYKCKDPWTHIYTVRFEEVSVLVGRRQVFLDRGDAYVLSRDLDAIASGSFCERLSRKLKRMQEDFYETVYQERERLGPLLMSLPDSYASLSLRAVGLEEGSVGLQELPAVMEAFAPLCMRESYKKLRGGHRHKYRARMQLNLFFKAIGVTLDEVLVLWRTEFMKGKGGMSADTFQKQYSYNFRHQYGQEGSRIKYRPFCCQEVIHSSLDTSRTTGCPYKTYRPADIEDALRGMCLKSEVVKKVLEKAGEGEYQVACTHVLRARHGECGDVEHPNQYFIEARKKHAEENKGNKT
jgi:DNA primase large subunit